MPKVWILDTDTKGTGAHMEPLEQALRKRRAEPSPAFAVPKPAPRSTPVPEPRPPLRFKVVDVMTGELLAEGTSVADTVSVLDGIRSVVDVRVYAWDPDGEDWRLLTLGEQKALWELREQKRPLRSGGRA